MMHMGIRKSIQESCPSHSRFSKFPPWLRYLDSWDFILLTASCPSCMEPVTSLAGTNVGHDLGQVRNRFTSYLPFILWY